MKKYAGAILVSVAGLVAWWWWKRRQTGATLDPSGAVTIPPNGDTSLPALQQVGSNTYQDVTQGILDSVLDFVWRSQRGCWSFDYEDTTGTNRGKVWTNAVTKQTIKLPIGSPDPYPVCGTP